jgi:hypothetical protein
LVQNRGEEGMDFNEGERRGGEVMSSNYLSVWFTRGERRGEKRF